MTKKHLELIAKIYAASILVENDVGYLPDEVGLTEDEASYVGIFLNQIGEKMLKGHPSKPSLKEIVIYVEDLYYE